MTRFRGHWTNAIDEGHLTSEFYFDIGKEVCPQQASQIASTTIAGNRIGSKSTPSETNDDRVAETLLWKRCCLDSYTAWIQGGPTGDPTQKQVFYPFSMLHTTGSLTLEPSPRAWSREAGLIYTQFYPSSKEIFAAGNVYPFTNTALETLALDKKLRQTWELVGGGLSHNPVALLKAYLYTKLRCHFALLGSVQKSFGIREEHRVSQSLFSAIDRQMRTRQGQSQRYHTLTNQSTPYYRIGTASLLQWVRWNINKFCVGFETVYSFQDPHFVTWEHTRMMLMFLRCLQFSYSGGLI